MINVLFSELRKLYEIALNLAFSYILLSVSQEENNHAACRHFNEGSCMLPSQCVDDDIPAISNETSSAKCSKNETFKEPKKGLFNRINVSI